ncbi:hypothetical protein BU24DRAFT_467734 [Aaosphaeria arxii CBS 175.79]|uniref:Rhodopsin domain-containing protein n=1 Tax=Aaosphaeria arxii CBS 175.79 TaxID=1450172 RepID=A0A6A5X8G6_9PLEO|nr:uncharacterized protein BU24DRAFT_467734 [Aaosphaeria arxii CBS 175.79]KAF2009345.1 hypothetical protein BU24DRAFT_467734 [Aaosphaeria arxii CBS 175.79]
MAIAGKGGTIIATLISFYIISLVSMCLRVYVRCKMKRIFGLDDVFAICSQLTFTVLLVTLILGADAGIGQHAANLSMEQFSNGVRYYFVCELIYVTTTWLIKTSFCLTLYRVTTNRGEKTVIYIILSIIFIFTIFYFFFILHTCSPIPLFWERLLPAHSGTGTCREPASMVAATYGHGAVMLFADISLAMLPISVLKGVQMSRRLKATVVLLLAIGSIAAVATIARLPYVHFLEDPDFLYANAEIAIWSVVEVGISVMATSSSTLRPLAAKIRLLASRTGRSTAGNFSIDFGAGQRVPPQQTFDLDDTVAHPRAARLKSYADVFNVDPCIGLLKGSSEERILALR